MGEGEGDGDGEGVVVGVGVGEGVGEGHDSTTTYINNPSQSGQCSLSQYGSGQCWLDQGILSWCQTGWNRLGHLRSG